MSHNFLNKLNVCDFDKLEIGFKVLNNNINIPEPDENDKRKNLYLINTNQNLKYKLENKIVLNEQDVVRIRNTGNGNCYYKCLSQFYTNNEIFHMYYRKIICELIETLKEWDKLNFLIS